MNSLGGKSMNMQLKKGTMLATFAFVLAACATPSSSVSSSATSTVPEFDTTRNIVLYTRDTTSGTRAGFFEGIGFKDAGPSDSVLTDGFVIRDNTAQLAAMGGADKYGIGYISTSSLNNTVKGLNFAGVAPTTANVINNTYGLKRPFMWMLRAPFDFPGSTAPAGNAAGVKGKVELISEAFTAFINTTDGTDTIARAGAIGIYSGTATWDSVKATYPVCNQDNAATTVRLGGSDSIQKVAEALTLSFKAKCGNFVPAHEHTGSSDAYRRTNGANKDQSVGKDIGFSSRPFRNSGADLELDVPANQRGQLAWDAIVAITHKDNPLSNVNADILKRMYEKASALPIRTWEEAITASAAL
jgi:phosphate transport system substrate-binding protein